MRTTTIAEMIAALDIGSSSKNQRPRYDLASSQPKSIMNWRRLSTVNLPHASKPFLIFIVATLVRGVSTIISERESTRFFFSNSDNRESSKIIADVASIAAEVQG